MFMLLQTSFGFDSCIMGKSWPVITRLVLGTLVQILCSYSTLPLYALVTQVLTQLKIVSQIVFCNDTLHFLSKRKNRPEQYYESIVSMQASFADWQRKATLRLIEF